MSFVRFIIGRLVGRPVSIFSAMRVVVTLRKDQNAFIRLLRGLEKALKST
jgi:hypothetical protein